MMLISSPFRETALLSSRTAKYVEAMIREGANFDYVSWLKKVREEEAQANQCLAASNVGQVASVKIGNRPVASHERRLGRYVAAASMLKTMPAPGAIGRSGRDSRSTTTKGRLRRWLEKVQAAWPDFQASRARDAV
jgi:hypothetical protein